MPLTESTMMELGRVAPDFLLPEPLTGNTVSLSELRGAEATLVIFMCNHCPYVMHILDGIVELAADYQPRGVATIAISANDITTHPQDAPEKMAELASAKGFSFPYLYDASQQIAKAYKAACTPDFFLFDQQLACVYRGRMDGAKFGNDVPVTGAELRAALDATLSGNQPNAKQLPSIGCNIKWRAA